MKRVRIVRNGQRGAGEEFLRNVVGCLRQHDGVHVDVRPTWEAGDAVGIAAEAAALGVDVIVAAGGDGTLHEVVNGLARAETRPSLGVIPLGTANDFATTVGIAPSDPVATAAIIAEEEPAPVDVVRVGDRFMINVATGGFPADEKATPSEAMKRALGGLAYLFSGVSHLGSYDAQYLELEGPDFEWHGSFLGFAVANARCAGGGHRVAPDALIDDGLIDVVVVPGNLRLFDAARLGSDLKIEAVEEHAFRWQTPWVSVWSDSNFRMNIDGEPYQLKNAKFECLAGHVDMCLPESCAVIRGGEEDASS